MMLITSLQVSQLIAVRNRFQQLLQADEEEQTPNELWEYMKEVVLSEAKKHIPKKRRKKHPWISETTLNLASKRKEAKVKGNTSEWSQLNREVTRSGV